MRELSVSGFRKGRASLSSHSFHGVARYVDQSEAFARFARSTCAEAAACAPAARFEAGGVRTTGLLATAAAILGVGLVLLLVGAITAGALGLGAELAARFSFVLVLMFAIAPWLRGAGVRRFDPDAIPDDLLP